MRIVKNGRRKIEKECVSYGVNPLLRQKTGTDIESMKQKGERQN